jgi:DNA-binding GntR family transcriptional regulator
MVTDTPRFVRPPTLTVTVANHIREAIVRGEMAPGLPLHEVELSTALKVSRGTVREALRLLHDEDLVDILPHQGASVMTLSPRKAWEIYTLRAQLEPYAVRLALENQAYTLQDLEELDALVGRLGEHDGDPFDSISADMEFHRVMCERGGHGVLMDMLGSLRSQTRLFILNTMIYHSDTIQDEVMHRTILATPRRSCETTSSTRGRRSCSGWKGRRAPPHPRDRPPLPRRPPAGRGRIGSGWDDPRRPGHQCLRLATGHRRGRDSPRDVGRGSRVGHGLERCGRHDDR